MNLNLDILPNTGKIIVNKKDEETLKPIEGVTFSLSSINGTVIKTDKTNENGVVTFSNLYQGEYILKEISTNDSYILNSSEFNLSVLYNKETVVDITNKYKDGNLKVIKVDKENNEIKIKDVEFKIIDIEGNLIGTYITDENGEIYIENLKIGEYILKEIGTDEDYILNEEEITVLVEYEKTTRVIVENECKKGSIKIYKVDSDNNQIKLEGVEFAILDDKMNILEILITDENGEGVTKEYSLRDHKKIYIKEISTRENYILNSEIIEIQLNPNEKTEIIIENKKKEESIYKEELPKTGSKNYYIKSALDVLLLGIFGLVNVKIKPLKTY